MPSWGMDLRQRRKERGLTLRQVADQIGTSHVFLSEVELGKRPLPGRHRAVLALILGVEPNALSAASMGSKVDVRDLAAEDRLKVFEFAQSLRVGRVA